MGRWVGWVDGLVGWKGGKVCEWVGAWVGGLADG